MSTRWTEWKCYPHTYRGDLIEAPTGPGVYEVCNASTREQIAFGVTPDVARALSDVLVRRKGILSSFRWPWQRSNGEMLEYRAWPTATVADAKVAVSHILGNRVAMIRRFASTRV